MRRLDDVGYVEPAFAAGSGRRSLSLHAGAVAVASWLERTLPLELREQRRAFASDVDARVSWAESMVRWLSGWQGPGDEHIEPALEWTDFWRQYGADPDLVALDSKRRSAFDRLTDGDGSETARADVRKSDEAYLQRLQHLADEHVPEVSLGDLPQLRRRGAGLRQAKTLGTLLGRYRTLDMHLRVFEEALAEVAVSWDRHVEAEADRARGKTPRIRWTDDDGNERTFYFD